MINKTSYFFGLHGWKECLPHIYEQSKEEKIQVMTTNRIVSFIKNGRVVPIEDYWKEAQNNTNVSGGKYD